MLTVALVFGAWVMVLDFMFYLSFRRRIRDQHNLSVIQLSQADDLLMHTFYLARFFAIIALLLVAWAWGSTW